MADSAQLPEVFDDGDGLVVRLFPAERAAGFAYLPQTRRRATPAIIRRLFSTAARYAAEETDCLICGTPASREGRILVAVEMGGDQQIGCICSDCAAWGLGDVAAKRTIPNCSSSSRV